MRADGRGDRLDNGGRGRLSGEPGVGPLHLRDALGIAAALAAFEAPALALAALVAGLRYVVAANGVWGCINRRRFLPGKAAVSLSRPAIRVQLRDSAGIVRPWRNAAVRLFAGERPVSLAGAGVRGKLSERNHIRR